MSIFRPLAAHAEGHLEVTTIVVVVIDIYLYDYYYVTGYSELPYGSRVRQSRECHDDEHEGPEPGIPGIPVPLRARDLGPTHLFNGPGHSASAGAAASRAGNGPWGSNPTTPAVPPGAAARGSGAWRLAPPGRTAKWAPLPACHTTSAAFTGSQGPAAAFFSVRPTFLPGMTCPKGLKTVSGAKAGRPRPPAGSPDAAPFSPVRAAGRKAGTSPNIRCAPRGCAPLRGAPGGERKSIRPRRGGGSPSVYGASYHPFQSSPAPAGVHRSSTPS